MYTRKIIKNDIVEADLSGAVGSEQGKIRPCVVIQNDIGNRYSPTIIVMPLSSCVKNLHMPTHALIKKDEDNGLTVDSITLAEQIRVIDKIRIKYKVGHIYDESVQNDIKKAYLSSFDL